MGFNNILIPVFFAHISDLICTKKQKSEWIRKLLKKKSEILK